MPTGISDGLARKKFPFSFRELDRLRSGASRSPIAALAFQDAVVFFDDFLGDTINTDIYTTGETGTGTPFAVAATGSASGAITGITGALDNNATTIRGHRIWAGDNNAWMEMRVSASVATGLALEVGFIDTASDLTLPVVGDIDTPATAGGTTNAAVLHLDTDQTLVTMAFFSDGSTANMNATAQTLSPVFTPTISAWHTYRVGVVGDIPFGAVDGGRFTTSGSGVIGHRTEGGTMLAPWLAVRTRAAAAVTVYLDYVLCMQDRATRTA